MSPDESVLQFSNRILQLSATIKSMNVEISESEMAIALLNGLPEEYNVLISALDALDEDETELNSNSSSYESYRRSNVSLCVQNRPEKNPKLPLC